MGRKRKEASTRGEARNVIGQCITPSHWWWQGEGVGKWRKDTIDVALNPQKLVFTESGQCTESGYVGLWMFTR